MQRAICLVIFASMAGSVLGQWRAVSESDSRQRLPDKLPSGGKEYKVGDEWPKDQRFRWLVADLEIPAVIDGQPSVGKAVGLQFNCGDGGEVYVASQLKGRYDNDHPLLVTLADKAEPKQKISVAVQVFGTVQGG